MTKSFTRPGIVTSRSSDRELDKYLGDAGRAMNAFPAQRRVFISNGTGLAQNIWTSGQAYLPGTLIKVVAEVVGTSASGVTWLDWRLRETFQCNTVGSLASLASQVDYQKDSGDLDPLAFVPNSPASRLLSLIVGDRPGLPMKWTAVVQILEQQP